MRVAVTGAAGFIGSHLCEALIQEGYDVVGIDSLTADYARERKLANLARLRAHPRFVLHVMDLQEPAATPVLAGCDAVCHLAGLGGSRRPDESVYTRANVDSVRRVLDAAVGSDIRRVVLASSSSVYRPSRNPASEDSALAPLSPYGRSKLAGETIARDLAASGRVELVVLRYFSVYGPRQRPDMVFARYIEATRSHEPMPWFGDGHQRRDFTYVGDAVAGTIAALQRGRAGATYNLSGGRSVGLNDALRELGRALGGSSPSLSPRPVPVPEPTVTVADLTRAHRELGYRPQVDLARGVASQVAASQPLIAAPR